MTCKATLSAVMAICHSLDMYDDQYLHMQAFAFGVMILDTRWMH